MTSERKGNNPVRSELVDIEEALKAGHAVEPVKEMQRSWAIAVGRQVARSAHAAVVTSCVSRRRVCLVC